MVTFIKSERNGLIYCIAAYSTEDDDGKDEAGGGFCGLGLTFPVNIADGMNPHPRQTETESLFRNRTETEEV